MDEKDLRNAVKNAKSAFYTFKTKKKKTTRKEARRAERMSKKEKQHKFQLKKYNVETPVVPDQTEVVKKKRKRKKKKKKIVADDEDKSFDNAAYEAANKADEKLIASLGKKLGGNKKRDKLTPILKRDGLDYILEVCDPLTADSKGFSSDEEYLASKSKKKKKTEKEVVSAKMSDKEISDKLLFEDGDGSGDEDMIDEFEEGEDDKEFEDEDEGNLDDEIFGDNVDDDYGGDDGDDDDDDDEAVDDDNDGTDDIDEDGAGADAASDVDEEESSDEDSDDNKEDNQTSKYIPPALRNQKKENIDKKKLNDDRIRKKLKGFLNRVSEGTIPGIVSEVESLYSSNGRNFMNEVLYEMMFEACVSTITTPEKLVIQNMIIVTALQLLTNSEVASYFLQMLAEKFSKLHEDSPSYGEGKTCHNVLLMLVSLYNLKVVDSILIYDLINKCLETFSEQDVSLIFLVIKSCGPNIRKDDPGALKNMIMNFREKSAEVKTDDKSYLNFMLEAIDALKNNNIRKLPLYDATIVEDARKCLKAVLLGRSKISEVQLKVSLKDLLDAEEKGRWWITGSAWSGRGPVEDKPAASDEATAATDFSDAVLKAAKKQHMNTNIRKQIFCVMVSSEDYIDAFEKLLKLNLKEIQCRDIIHVVVDCCLQEKTYNPFYAHLANKFCDFNKSYVVTLQYSLWDRFKTIPKMKKHSMTNMEQFLAHMIASKSLSLSVLKIVTFGALDEISINFFSRFFTTFLLQFPQNSVKNAFQRISNLPKLSLLRQGIKIFLRHFLYPDDQKNNGNIDVNKEKLKELIEMAELALDGCDYVPL